MKKLAGLLAGLCAALLATGVLLCGCTDWKPERPKDTNLEFWILDDVAGYDWSAHDREPPLWGFDPCYFGKGYHYVQTEDGTLLEPEHYVKYVISPWPDLSSPSSHIVSIRITDPAVNIYGLTVNSTFEEFRTVFEKKGYEVKTIKIKEKNDTIRATRSGFGFTLGKLNGVNAFRIGTTVTNNEGILF